MSGLLFCPKYIGLLVAFSIIKSFQNDPKWLDWRWILIVGFSIYTFGSMIYNRYKSGLSVGILVDVFWLLLYSCILFIYLPKFNNKDQVDKRVNQLPFNIGNMIMTMTGIIVGICVAIVVLCISQLIPIINVVTIPLAKMLSVIL
jgi:hypothetical protein